MGSRSATALRLLSQEGLVACLGRLACAPRQLLQPAVSLREFWSAGAGAGSAADAPARQAQPWRGAASAASPQLAETEQTPAYALLERRITGPYRVTPRPVFAVVEVGGVQHKVTPDDLLITEHLAGVDVNDTLRLGRVLLLGSRDETVIGRPYVPGAAVIAAVEEQFLDGKVLIFHKRRRKNSRRLRGHRQPLTSLRILEVLGLEPPGPPSSPAADPGSSTAAL